MSGNSNDLTQQLMNVVNSGQQAVMSESVIRASGSGKAYQSVAQSAAIAVQDAADNLRNISIMSSTAAGVALSQMLAQGDPEGKYSATITQANQLIQNAATNFETIGENAANVLNKFPTS